MDTPKERLAKLKTFPLPNDVELGDIPEFVLDGMLKGSDLEVADRWAIQQYLQVLHEVRVKDMLDGFRSRE